jgi:hypothetical protein
LALGRKTRVGGFASKFMHLLNKIYNGLVGKCRDFLNIRYLHYCKKMTGTQSKCFCSKDVFELKCLTQVKVEDESI